MGSVSPLSAGRAVGLGRLLRKGREDKARLLLEVGEALSKSHCLHLLNAAVEKLQK